MEVGSESSVDRAMWVCSVTEAMVVESVVAAGKALTFLLFLTAPLLNDANALSKLGAMDKRFPLDELHKMIQLDAENKDASDTEDDDDEDDDDNADDQDDDDDDDASDEDFSGDDGDEEADPEDNPEANGEGGSEDEDEDDNGDEDDENEDEEEEDEEEEELPQPPTKKRK